MLAVLVGVPLGLVLGWFKPAFLALNPFIQILRPISPIAWIPVAILWFGVKDTAPVGYADSGTAWVKTVGKTATTVPA